MASYATYNGVTFGVLSPDGFAPQWEQELVFSEEHYPDADYDEVQTAGMHNRSLVVEARITSAADLATLVGSQGSTQRTLVDHFGTSVSNVVLLGVTRVRQHLQGKVLAELEFRVIA